MGLIGGSHVFPFQPGRQSRVFVFAKRLGRKPAHADHRLIAFHGVSQQNRALPLVKIAGVGEGGGRAWALPFAFAFHEGEKFGVGDRCGAHRKRIDWRGAAIGVVGEHAVQCAGGYRHIVGRECTDRHRGQKYRRHQPGARPTDWPCVVTHDEFQCAAVVAGTGCARTFFTSSAEMMPPGLPHVLST